HRSHIGPACPVGIYSPPKLDHLRRHDVRLWSKADICSAKRHVRFAPNSDRESGFPQKVESALPPKADMCGANRNVRFGPKADISDLHQHTKHSPCGGRWSSALSTPGCGP